MTRTYEDAICDTAVNHLRHFKKYYDEIIKSNSKLPKKVDYYFLDMPLHIIGHKRWFWSVERDCVRFNEDEGKFREDIMVWLLLNKNKKFRMPEDAIC